METRHSRLAVCLVLLLLAALPYACARHASGRTLLGKIALETGQVDGSKAFTSPPPGRNCHTPGMHCIGDSQCCSKGCDSLYFRCK